MADSHTHWGHPPGGRMTLLLLPILAIFSAGVLAQPAATPKEKERAARLRRMRAIAEAVRVYRVEDDGRHSLQLVPEPLMSFVDQVDRNQDGSLWLFGRSGRPGVIMQIWRALPDGDYWYHALTSLSPGEVAADGKPGLRWTPRKAGVELKPFADPPAAAESKVARLRQMKELARRFSAHEILSTNSQRFQLRVFPRPVHRYVDEKSGLLDGAVFLFVRGSDPEAVLLVELAQAAPGSSRWQYALAPVASSEIRVSYSDQEVWHQPAAPGISGRPTDPYWIFAERVRRE